MANLELKKDYGVKWLLKVENDMPTIKIVMYFVYKHPWLWYLIM